jgi:hypothetical protein
LKRRDPLMSKCLVRILAIVPVLLLLIPAAAEAG